jgi:hypothetical protein
MRLIDALVWQGFDSLGTPRKGEGVSKFRDKDETVIPARKRLIVRSLHPPVAPLKASGAFLTGKRAGEAAHPVFSAGRKHNGSAFIRGLASAEEIRYSTDRCNTSNDPSALETLLTRGERAKSPFCAGEDQSVLTNFCQLAGSLLTYFPVRMRRCF